MIEEKLLSVFKYLNEKSNSNYIFDDNVIKALKFQSIPLNEEGIKTCFKGLKDSSMKKLNFEEF